MATVSQAWSTRATRSYGLPPLKPLKPHNPAQQHVNVGNPERMLSVAFGTGMLLYALGRTPLTTLLGAAGAGLVYRGVTGRCATYKTLGITTRNRSCCGMVDGPIDQACADIVDEQAAESFPASDAPASKSIT